MLNKAIFLDKDGTLIDDVPYNVNPAFIRLSENIVSGLMLLQRGGYLLIVVSNQPGLAFEYFTKDQLNAAKNYLTDLLLEKGIKLNGFYCCPHHPDGISPKYNMHCVCRKPLPGLLLQAARDLSIDIEKSWMIGDILNDVEAGKRAGCHTILIDNGNETEWLTAENRIPERKFTTINEAASYILTNVHNEQQLERV